MATATARRRRAIEHLVATDLARARLARAAFDAIADGLDLGPTAVRTAADRAWVQDAIAGPIQRTAEQALVLLVDDLIATLGGGAPALVGRIVGHAPDGASSELARDAAPAPWDGDRSMTDRARTSTSTARTVLDAPVAVLR